MNSYDVRFWQIETRKGKTVTYRVRWVVAGRQFSDTTCMGFTDTFRAAHDGDSVPAWTYDVVTNPYASNGLFAAEPPGVIDYVFASESDLLVAVRSEIVFKEPLTGADLLRAGLANSARLPARLSDHYGVLTTFEVRRPIVSNNTETPR